MTRKVLLVEDVQVAYTFGKRLKGLLGTRSFAERKGMLLKPCNSVHSCFMSFPFDVLFLDDHLVVVHAIHEMHPFRFSPIMHQAQSALELPAGTISSSGSVIGDQLVLRTCFY